MLFFIVQCLNHFFCNHTKLQSLYYITTLEKIAIFMHVVRYKSSNCDIQKRYQHFHLLLVIACKNY